MPEALYHHPLGPAFFALAVGWGVLWTVSLIHPPAKRALKVLRAVSQRYAFWPAALCLTTLIWGVRFLGAFGGPAEVDSGLIDTLRTLL